jgi:drug/metabolite transporter (DMT)-like permease
MTALVPVSAVAMAALLLHESVSGAQLAGVACVLGAVLLATVGHMWRIPRRSA